MATSAWSDQVETRSPVAAQRQANTGAVVTISKNKSRLVMAAYEEMKTRLALLIYQGDSLGDDCGWGSGIVLGKSQQTAEKRVSEGATHEAGNQGKTNEPAVGDFWHDSP